MPKDTLDESKTLYQKRLDLLASDQENLPFERAKNITEDIKNALADGAIFNELILPEIPKSFIKATVDSQIELLKLNGVAPANMLDSSLADNLFLSISEAMKSAINSEVFINRLGLEISQKEVGIEKEHHQEIGV